MVHHRARKGKCGHDCGDAFARPRIDPLKQKIYDLSHLNLVSLGGAILSEGLTRVVTPESQEVGWIAKKGFVPLGYLADAEKSAQPFSLVDGVRDSVPGDRAQYDASGKAEIS